MKNIRIFVSENFQFLEVKVSIYLNRRVFVMCFSVPIRQSLPVILRGYLIRLFVDTACLHHSLQGRQLL